MKKKSGKNSKDAQTIKRYEKTMALMREGFKALTEFYDLPVIQKHVAAQQPLPANPEQKVEEERRSNEVDLYDEMGNHIGFLKEIFTLIMSASHSDDEMPDLGWTTGYMIDHLEEIDKLREQWYDLRTEKKTEEGTHALQPA